MKQNFKFLVVILVLLTSCAKKLTETDLPKVKRLKTQDLLFSLDSLSKIRPNTFYSKISTKYSDTNRTISLKTSLRMIADSAINTIISYASFPVVNALITPDSLKITNKREKCYSFSNMEYIKENFGVDFTFQNIEEIILGLPLDYDTTQKYFQIHEADRYVISSHRKRRLKKNERIANRNDANIAIQYFLNRDAKKLDGIEIISADDTTSINVDYVKWQSNNGINIPEEVIIKVRTPKNNLFIELTYEKTKINEPLELYFIVPESYEECK